MQDFLNQVIWDNSIRSYLLVLLAVGMIALVRRMISKYFAGLIFKLVSKKGKHTLRMSFVDLVKQPLELFLITFITLIAVEKLKFPSVLDVSIYKVTLKHLVSGLGDMILIITFIWLCLRLIEFIALILEEKASKTADPTDNQLIVFFKDFLKVLIVLNGILLILHFVFHKDIGNLLTGLSIVGAAIALATRESLENLIASFIIFFDKPFVTGDLVKVQGFTGNIEKIGLRSTRIRTAEKTYISVPNKQMVDSIVDNISLRTQRKAELKLEIGLSASAQQLTALTTAIKQILTKPGVDGQVVFLSDTGRNAHVFTIEYMVSMEYTVEAFNDLRAQINLEIIQWLNAQQIELAAASTDVVVRQA
jgi:MscS family membrane protein